MAGVEFHTLSGAETAATLAVDPGRGLAGAEAARRALQHGLNALPDAARRSLLSLFAAQFREFMIIVLILAAVVSAVLGDIGGTLAIVVIVLLNAVIGFSQEWRAENALRALRDLAAARASVRRDGRVQQLDAAALVPGDVVLLEAGNVVPADLRLLEAEQLTIDESTLTGESVTVTKTLAPLAQGDSALADRVNLAYKGTLVAQGRGSGLVIAIGATTALGHIASLLVHDPRQRTPLQQRLTSFGRRIALFVLALCAVLFVAGVLRGEPAGLMAMLAISLAVAAIPEALPAVVTILLALGARRMAQAQALVRRLPAVETLGSVTRICVDKTGTLTENRMSLELVWLGDVRETSLPAVPAHAGGPALLTAITLASDADGESGEPTEVALVRGAAAAGYDKAALVRAFPRLAELSFSSARRCMTTLHSDPAGGAFTCTKGAPEAVLACCSDMLGPHGREAIDRALLDAVATALAADGLRVLAVAERRWPALPAAHDAATLERELCLLGFVGLLDPPRAEAHQAVAECQQAGIVPVMITGDHPATARAIARRLDIFADDGLVMSGQELARLDDAALAAIVEQVRVFARVEPEQKIRIVAALAARGHFVAMTGDGVNDAPALMRADIGVAMGRGGTDVAREAASLVLLDDNFATIVVAIKEGRRIYDNIRKFVRYAITGNSAEILTICLAPLAGLPIPLLPIHILWVNLVSDGLPGLALAAEPADAGIMQRPPRPPRESLFAHGVWQHILWVGGLIAAVCLVVQAWALHTGDSTARAQTMVFTVLTLSQMGLALAVRSEKMSLLRLGLTSNLPLLGAVLLTFALQLALIYVPVLNAVFGTVPLALTEFGMCMLASSVPLLAVELGKRWLASD